MFSSCQGFFGTGSNASSSGSGQESRGIQTRIPPGEALLSPLKDTGISTDWRLERSAEWKNLLPLSLYSVSIHEGTMPGLWSQSRHETKIILAQRLHGVTSVSFISAERLFCLSLFASRNPQQLNGSELGHADCILLSSGTI